MFGGRGPRRPQVPLLNRGIYGDGVGPWVLQSVHTLRCRGLRNVYEEDGWSPSRTVSGTDLYPLVGTLSSGLPNAPSSSCPSVRVSPDRGRVRHHPDGPQSRAPRLPRGPYPLPYLSHTHPLCPFVLPLTVPPYVLRLGPSLYVPTGSPVTYGPRVKGVDLLLGGVGKTGVPSQTLSVKGFIGLRRRPGP